MSDEPMSGYDSMNRNVLTRVRKVVRDGRADVAFGSRHAVPHMRAATKIKCSAAKSGEQ